MAINICIIAGARPNFIKIAPIVRAVEERKAHGDSNINLTVVYTGRSDDSTLEPSLFSDLSIRKPDVYLDVTDTDIHLITAGVTERLASWLESNHQDAVIVVDDLASTMAAAIVAKKQDILLAHLVAGTRSFDIHVPKEINRLVIDGLSDVLFTAGTSSNSTATREGVGQDRIFMVGNIIIDSLRACKNKQQRPACFDEIGVERGGYLLFTFNRRKIIADTANLRSMLTAMTEAAADSIIVAPLREYAAAAVREALGDKIPSNLHLIQPLSYLEFAYAESNALGIVTDSGNVAEEATFYGIPCATLNTYTEHAETISIGTNRLVGENAEMLGAAISDMKTSKWPHGAIPDRWDGRTADRILQTLLYKIGKK